MHIENRMDMNAFLHGMLLAVMMSKHARLGAESGLRILADDLVRLICELFCSEKFLLELRVKIVGPNGQEVYVKGAEIVRIRVRRVRRGQASELQVLGRPDYNTHFIRGNGYSRGSCVLNCYGKELLERNLILFYIALFSSKRSQRLRKISAMAWRALVSSQDNQKLLYMRSWNGKDHKVESGDVFCGFTFFLECVKINP